MPVQRFLLSSAVTGTASAARAGRGRVGFRAARAGGFAASQRPGLVAAIGNVVRIAPNRAAAPRDSRLGQNERLGDSAIRRFGNSWD